MPVKEGYAYADTPHEKTVIKPGWLYGCHSSNERVRPGPRGQTVQKQDQDGWTIDGRRRMTVTVTEQTPQACGHTLRSTDPACTGCLNRSED